jgi:hypothetical protein
MIAITDKLKFQIPNLNSKLKLNLAAFALMSICQTAALHAQTIDSFDNGVAAWIAAPASGVELNLGSAAGRTGKALEVSFDFHGQGGWAAFRKPVALNLADNYEISFWLKGEAPSNTLEFKLVDPSGENVWWVNRREFEFAGPWRKITFRKRHVTFAWGPAGGGDIRTVGAIELAITAGEGGQGTIWIDDLTISPREPVRPYDTTPVVSSAGNTRSISHATASMAASSWIGAGPVAVASTRCRRRWTAAAGKLCAWYATACVRGTTSSCQRPNRATCD